MIKAQEEGRATGISWSASGFADDIRRTRELITKFSDFDTFARGQPDPRIVTKTLKD